MTQDMIHMSKQNLSRTMVVRILCLHMSSRSDTNLVTQYAGAPSQPPSTNIHPFTAQLQPQPQPQPQPQVQPQPQLQAVYQQTRTSGFQLTPAMLEAYERSRLSQASRFQAPVSVPASDAGPSNSNQQYSRPDFDFTQNVAYTLNGW
ncbi:hypothetical protein K474DRAFT_639149 [Panus rudis PR-1116 ss-1]|nr:hypothetical protein K474DRAFT_639149 [Panus rudis PR-1116 ss-1]